MIGKSFEKLVNIMTRLRGPDGCPWDREQTHDSLKQYLLEEAYEVLETIDMNDAKALQEELGDLLLQPVFHAQIAAENGQFTMDDVINTINRKLIRRHPHVFGDTEIHTAEEQKIHWETLKKGEGKKSVLEGVPKQAPALLRAYRVQQKASTVGFDWEKSEQVWKKVHEEINELHDALDRKEAQAVTEEYGDLLFALVNLSRFIGVQPEDALRKAVNKFIHRFHMVEDQFKKENRNIKEASLEELDEVWETVKLKKNTAS